MRNVAELILKALVGHPENVRIEEALEGDRLNLTVHVDPADLGRVIGRQGRTINAVRTVVKASALKAQQYVNLDLVSPDKVTSEV
jgi:predicted RNA-binding protein YlqC (UPF0109 family)